MLIEDTGPQRPALTNLTLEDEAHLIETLLKDLEHLHQHRSSINGRAKKWIEEVRKAPLPLFHIQKFLQAFPLTQGEGRSLMALAEAYLRIPDAYTAGLLLKDKLSLQSWRKEKRKEDFLVGFSRWGLDLLGYIERHKWTSFAHPLGVQTFKIFMGLLSHEFILGETIEKALKRRLKLPEARISFDMLGEGARTFTMAQAYQNAYIHAIQTLGEQDQKDLSLFEKDSLSVKLSALHPQYTFAHRDEVMGELLPKLIELCVLAKEAGIGLTVDAEEASRLELSLDVIEGVCATSELKGWEGFGFAIQSYQKCAPAVIEWAEALSRTHHMPLMIRLVKGAYWDREIKIAQAGGYPAYPVYTRKAATDLCYLACAQKLLKAEGYLYPQFATHNAHTISCLLEMTKGREDIEFQRLQGMGEALYKVVRETHPVPCRIYAPVGKNKDLLSYLVRRLLENGANSSFIHKIYDADLPVKEVLGDPWEFFQDHPPSSHPLIRLPQNLYGEERKNSQGCDLSNRLVITQLKTEIIEAAPSYGTVKEATLQDLDKALTLASTHWETWDLTPAERRADILNQAADLIEKKRGLFLGLLIQEGKKTLPDALAEVRETVDFCRYYAGEALKHFASPQHLPGPTGEQNELILRGRGVFACISPWNFPLAILTGQITAALAAGNAVISKPATPTPLIAFHAIQTLHEAGVPREVLHFLPGKSKIIGDPLVKDLRLKGVVFTGSTSTAQHIQKTLAERGGPIIPLIAETGGINAMIMDSSALIAQAVDDIVASSFQSAGQRCSSLRILFIQEDIYAPTLAMLNEVTESLRVGDSQWLSSDVGPVIDAKAQHDIETYIASYKPLMRTPLSPSLEGSFVAPTLIEVKGMEDVKQEVFGPVLHVTRFHAKDLEHVVQTINQSGYGLTFGLQSRIDSTIRKVRSLIHAGNFYVNRNMIGAVVGVQPFGGEGLSGTGPKAGGPYYLPRFAAERTFTNNITASGGNLGLVNLSGAEE